MLISKAYAQGVDAATETLANAPSATEAFAWNMGLVLVLVVLFYVLMIMPQQRRFKEHGKMLSELKKGDKVVTGGGLVGKVEKIVSDEEIAIDLGGGMKVTALRSTIHGKTEAPLSGKAANDKDSKSPKTDEPKKAPVKKTTKK